MHLSFMMAIKFISEKRSVLNLHQSIMRYLTPPAIIMIAKQEIADSFFNDYVVLKKGQFPKRNDNWFPLFQSFATVALILNKKTNRGNARLQLICLYCKFLLVMYS